jgi:hypothetical protein
MLEGQQIGSTQEGKGSRDMLGVRCARNVGNVGRMGGGWQEEE